MLSEPEGNLRVTKMGLQTLSPFPEELFVTKMGMQTMSPITEELHVTKMGLQVMSKWERPSRRVSMILE